MHAPTDQVIRAASIGLSLALAACGNGPLASAGSDEPAQLSLTMSMSPLTLADLVVTSGEIELEHVGLYGDTDDNNQLRRVTIQLGDPMQRFVFPTAAPGIYSRLRTEIDHVSIDGSWHGAPLHIETDGDERVIDLRSSNVALSGTQSAGFTLTIDASQWLSVGILGNGAPTAGNGLEIDEQTCPSVVDTIMTLVMSSFSFTAS
jgi:hypothetical protein